MEEGFGWIRWKRKTPDRNLLSENVGGGSKKLEKNHICWFKNWCKTTKNTRASKCVLLVSVNKMSILTLN